MKKFVPLILVSTLFAGSFGTAQAEGFWDSLKQLGNALSGNKQATPDGMAATVMNNTHSSINRSKGCWMKGDICFKPASLFTVTFNGTGQKQYYLLAKDEDGEMGRAEMFVFEQVDDRGNVRILDTETAGSNGYIEGTDVQIGKNLYGWKIHSSPMVADQDGYDTYYVFHNGKIRDMGSVYTIYTKMISSRFDKRKQLPISRVNEYTGETKLDTSNPNAEIYPLKITYKGILNGTKECGGCDVTGGKKLSRQTLTVQADPQTMRYRIPSSCPVRANWK